MVLLQGTKYLKVLSDTYPTLFELLAQYDIATLDERDVARLIEQARIE